MNEILDYISEHLADLKEGYENCDGADSMFHYYEGSIETLEHLLARFGND